MALVLEDHVRAYGSYGGDRFHSHTVVYAVYARLLNGNNWNCNSDFNQECSFVTHSDGLRILFKANQESSHSDRYGVISRMEVIFVSISSYDCDALLRVVGVRSYRNLGGHYWSE